MDTYTNNLTITVSGSFRKHFNGIATIIREFESLGVSVLSPKPSHVVNPGEEFAILATDDTADPKILEQRYLDDLEKADALYVFNPEGYIGASATMELGWALYLGKPIFCKEVPSDFVLKLFTGTVATPKQVREILLNRPPTETINERSSVGILQHYIHQMVVRRGFDDETPRDILLLFIEEVGELAKAIRKHLGLKIDQGHPERHTELQSELADIFIYLLDLANALGISLSYALIEKEKENENRYWG